MFRFLRRVFIILVLLIIVFFIFRIVKPEATNRFVDKVKSIPTTISSRFNRSKDPEIIINGKSNKEKNKQDETNEIGTVTNIDTENTEPEEIVKENQNDGDINDMVRLEELNKEIESIIQDNQTGSDGNITETTEPTNNQETNNNENSNIIIEEINNAIIEAEQSEEQESGTNTEEETPTTETTINTSTILTQEQRGNCAKMGLSVKDCEDLVRDLGHYN